MLWIDTETFSETPIKFGTYRYALDCEVMIVTYAFGDDEVLVWDRTADPKMPADLAAAFDSDEELTAHYAMFDRNVIRESLNFDLPIERWRCTMVQALSHGLPGSLGKLCEIFKIGEDDAKIKEGKELVRLFCKPRPKSSKIRRATRLTHPEQWAQFVEYAKGDIRAMRALAKKMPSWNNEWSDYHLDQRVNDRGFPLELPFVEACIVAAGKEQKRLAAQTHEVTNGVLSSTTKRDALLEHLFEEYGVSLPDLQGDTVERRLNDESLPQGLRDLLLLRTMASTTCVSKYKSMERAAVEGRVKGTLQFNGAGRTGRWAGRTVQPQNFPSKGLLPKEDVLAGREAILLGCEHLLYDNVMLLLASRLRSAIVATPGKKLVWADLSNVEGRIDAWLAGEEWKLQAFRDYDAGTGTDLYVASYARAFGVTTGSVIDDKKRGGSQRQIGKVMELMLAREGGVGAFVTGAEVYHLDLEELALAARPAIPADVWDEASGFLEWTIKSKRNTFGLSNDAFIVCDSLKRLWRRAHPKITGLWATLKGAATAAILHPGTSVPAGEHLLFRRDGAWLRLRLPSGRYLCYPSPQIDDKGQISHMGMNQYTHQWCRMKTYGGKFFAESSQATAACVLKGNLLKIEEAGYEVVFTVHDEVVTEVEKFLTGAAERLALLLAAPQSWSEGLPLAAKGVEDYHYGKD